MVDPKSGFRSGGRSGEEITVGRIILILLDVCIQKTSAPYAETSVSFGRRSAGREEPPTSLQEGITEYGRQPLVLIGGSIETIRVTGPSHWCIRTAEGGVVGIERQKFGEQRIDQLGSRVFIVDVG